MSGTLDGANHTIKVVDLSSIANSASGMFGTVGADATCLVHVCCKSVPVPRIIEKIWIIGCTLSVERHRGKHTDKNRTTHICRVNGY